MTDRFLYCERASLTPNVAASAPTVATEAETALTKRSDDPIRNNRCSFWR
jgi:hypothetical protein